MKFGLIFRLAAYAALIFGYNFHAVAQTNSNGEPEILRVEVGGPYQLKDSYSILYDNTAQTAKLKEFRVIFYAPNRQKITETKTETHPLTGHRKTYKLSEPVVGFSEIGLSIISLHSGNIDDFPADIGPFVGMDRTVVPPPATTLTEAEKQRLVTIAENISESLSDLSEKLDQFTNAQNVQVQNNEHLRQLIQDAAALLERNNGPASPDQEPQINALSADIKAVQTEAKLAAELEKLNGLKSKILQRQSQVEDFINRSETEGADITNVMASVAAIEVELQGSNAATAGVELPVFVTISQIEAWDNDYLELQSNAVGQRLGETKSMISDRLSRLGKKSEQFTRANESRAKETGRLETLIQNTAALLEEDDSPALSDLVPQINALSADMETAQRQADLTILQTELTTLETEIVDQQTQIENLLRQSDAGATDIPALMASLAEIEAALEGQDADIASIDLPEAVTTAKIDTWNAAYLNLKKEIIGPPTWPIIVAALVIGLVVLGLGAKFILGTQTQPRPSKSVLNRAEPSGVIFPASPMLAGNVAAPLAPAGQLAAAQLQMLNGPYAALKPAYQATGRIGYAQAGVPTSDDYAFGTGFLVSDRHIVTNRHVHGLYGHYLLDEADPGGIEFIAEKGKDASDFVPFNGQPPLLLPALDIAIYTLARPVTNRPPISLKLVDTEHLLEREIVVIGYPDTHNPKNPEVLAVVEDDPVFAVKRLSQGQIFRHSTDTDTPLGVETSVAESKSSKFLMPAICHNASTMGGNSGSPLLDLKTGELVGVHFAGFKVFNQQEAANLAMAIAQLEEIKTVDAIQS